MSSEKKEKIFFDDRKLPSASIPEERSKEIDAIGIPLLEEAIEKLRQQNPNDSKRNKRKTAA